MALNQREKALLALPILLGGVFAFYSYVHEPLFARRALAMADHEQGRRDLQLNEAKLRKEGDLRARLSAVSTREQLVDDWVPGKNSAALLIWYLSQAEQASGARIKGIKVGEKKEVVATPGGVEGAGTPPNTQGNQPGNSAGAAQPGDQNSTAANGQNSSGSAVDPNTQANSQGNTEAGAQSAGPLSTTLTLVTLELKVDANFVEHLLFNQEVEKMPLFLNTTGLALDREKELPFEQAGKLVQEGQTHWAQQLLGVSPLVGGTYQLNLYFKGGKIGPATQPMHFDTPAGRRIDPFLLGGIDEFIQTLQDHYANVDQELDELPGGGRGPNPGPRKGQLG